MRTVHINECKEDIYVRTVEIFVHTADIYVFAVVICVRTDNHLARKRLHWTKSTFVITIMISIHLRQQQLILSHYIEQIFLLHNLVLIIC